MTLTLPVTLRASSALAAATTEYGTGYETPKLTSAATATTSNKLTDSAGLFTTTTAAAVGDIIKNTTTGKYALVTAVDSATALSISADIMSQTDAYVLYSGTGYKLQQAFKEMMVQLDVSAAATEAGDTLDVYVDMAMDGAGTKWNNVGHFTQVLGNGGAKTFVMVIKNDNPGATAVFATTSDAAAGATRQIGFGDRIRYRAVTVDASTANASFTYSLKAFFK